MLFFPEQDVEGSRMESISDWEARRPQGNKNFVSEFPLWVLVWAGTPSFSHLTHPPHFLPTSTFHNMSLCQHGTLDYERLSWGLGTGPVWTADTGSGCFSSPFLLLRKWKEARG